MKRELIADLGAVFFPAARGRRQRARGRTRRARRGARLQRTSAKRLESPAERLRAAALGGAEGDAASAPAGGCRRTAPGPGPLASARRSAPPCAASTRSSQRSEGESGSTGWRGEALVSESAGNGEPAAFDPQGVRARIAADVRRRIAVLGAIKKLEVEHHQRDRRRTGRRRRGRHQVPGARPLWRRAPRVFARRTRRVVRDRIRGATGRPRTQRRSSSKSRGKCRASWSWCTPRHSIRAIRTRKRSPSPSRMHRMLRCACSHASSPIASSRFLKTSRGTLRTNRYCSRTRWQTMRLPRKGGASSSSQARYLSERGIAARRIFTVSALDYRNALAAGRAPSAWNELGALIATIQADAEEHMARLARVARLVEEGEAAEPSTPASPSNPGQNEARGKRYTGFFAAGSQCRRL